MKQTSKQRDFELQSFNISVPADYDDKDFFGFKAGQNHTKKKLNISGKKRRL